MFLIFLQVICYDWLSWLNQSNNVNKTLLMDPGCTQSTQAGVVIDLTEESDDDDDDVEIVPM